MEIKKSGWNILILIFCIFFYVISTGITALLYYTGAMSMDTAFFWMSIFSITGLLLVVFLFILMIIET